MNKWVALIIMSLFPQMLWAADIQAILQWSQRVELTTPVSGIVQAVKVDVGDLVQKGQSLLILDSTIFQAKVTENQSEIERLSAEVEEDKRDLDRIKELYERSVVSTIELDQSKLKLVRSQAMLSESRARMRQFQKMLEDATLRAPFDAIVVLRQVEKGQSVVTGLQPQTLLTVAKSGEMYARMQLLPSQMKNLKIGQEVNVKVAETNYSGKIKTLGLEPVKIKEEFVYPVDVIFPTKQILRAGTQAQVNLP